MASLKERLKQQEQMARRLRRRYILKLTFKLGLGFLAFVAFLGALGAIFSGTWGLALILTLILGTALWGGQAIGVSIRRS